jgi:hypothetical protein
LEVEKRSEKQMASMSGKFPSGERALRRISMGEYIDQDNVTASFGEVASQSYTVP